MRTPGTDGPALLSVVDREQLQRASSRGMLDEAEFLSPLRHPRAVRASTATTRSCCRSTGMVHRVDYEPAESTTGLFGGNSNWRGPVWFPVNYLLIESLQKFHRYYGDGFRSSARPAPGRC